MDRHVFHYAIVSHPGVVQPKVYVAARGSADDHRQLLELAPFVVGKARFWHSVRDFEPADEALPEVQTFVQRMRAAAEHVVAAAQEFERAGEQVTAADSEAKALCTSLFRTYQPSDDDFRVKPLVLAPAPRRPPAVEQEQQEQEQEQTKPAPKRRKKRVDA